MYIAQRSHFPSFTPFRSSSKRSLPNKNFDLVTRSFDDSLLRRLKPLTPTSPAATPSFGLSWISRALDFLSAAHAEAHALIADLGPPSSHDAKTPPSCLDGSLKILDACNSISSEIERLRRRRLAVNFALQLLELPGDGGRLPAPEKLRRARDLLSDRNDKSSSRRRALLKGPEEASVGNLVLPRGKISSAGEVIRRTICAVGVLTAFVSGVAVAALSGEDAAAAIGIPAEFVWAEPLRGIGSAVGVPAEVGDVEERVRVLRGIVNGVVEGVKGGDQEGEENVVRELGNAVKEVEAAMGRFSDGLDRLADGVNGTFSRVLCSRNGMVEEYRKGLGTCGEEQLKCKPI